MSNATLQIGGGNWAAQDGKLLGYAVEPTSGRYLARELTVDRNSSKWVLGSDGYLKEYTTDQPAIEFNPDGSYKGVLVEPQSINLCLQSENFSTTWSPIGSATITTNQTTAPDGNTTADKLGDDGSTGTDTVQAIQTLTVVGGAKYTASVFLKKSGLDWALIEALGAGSAGNANPSQYFDLDTGVLGTGNAGIQDATIVEYPNDWYRCSITWTQGAADTSFQFRIYVAEADGDVIVDLDGTSSIFVWGAQLEESPIATSYIPTTTGAVTRVKDDIYITGASSLIGQTEGTLYVEVDFRQTGLDQRILQASDGTGANRIIIWAFSTNTYMQINIGGSTVANLVASSLADGVQKLAFAYANNDQEFYRNGSSVTTATGNLSALPTLTDIDLGQSSVATAQANMWIRDARIYNTRLTDTQCQDLTTL